jgi:spore germination protein YaaH
VTRTRRWIGPVVLVLVAIAAVAVIGQASGGGPATSVAQPSDGTPAGDHGPGGIRAGAGSPSPALAAEPTPDPTPIPEPKHEVYGFLPYWEMDDTIAAHVRKTDLTTLGLFSVTHRRSGALATGQTGYKRIVGSLGKQLIRDAHRRDRRVELVYTSFGETKNRRFYAEPKAQARWIKELVELVDEVGADGINVDVELLPADLVPAYGSFVGRLRAALVERLPKAQLSVATQANETGAAMAVAAAEAGADRIFMMGYDYHWAGSNPGASAPIERLDGRPKDLVWSLDLYAALGVPVDRTLLGLPLYGMTWPVTGPGVGALERGRGETWVPRRNLRVLDDADFEPTYEPVESVEFYSVAEEPKAPTPDPSDPLAEDARKWHAVYYDSPRSLTPKLALADARGLAGAGFWAIGYERGLPDYTKLIKTFKAGKLQVPES